MGGSACVVIINAVVRYDEVPQHSKERKELESQLRDCYYNSTIAAAIAENEQTAMTVCKVLSKPTLTPADLQVLLDALPEYSEVDDTPGG